MLKQFTEMWELWAVVLINFTLIYASIFFFGGI